MCFIECVREREESSQLLVAIVHNVIIYIHNNTLEDVDTTHLHIHYFDFAYFLSAIFP